MKKNMTDILRTEAVLNFALSLIPKGGKKCTFYLSSFKVIGSRLLAPVQNSVSPKLMNRKTMNFVINLPDVENLTK